MIFLPSASMIFCASAGPRAGTASTAPLFPFCLQRDERRRARAGEVDVRGHLGRQPGLRQQHVAQAGRVHRQRHRLTHQLRAVRQQPIDRRDGDGPEQVRPGGRRGCSRISGPAATPATAGAAAARRGRGRLRRRRLVGARHQAHHQTNHCRSTVTHDAGKISRVRRGGVEIFLASYRGELRRWEVLGTVTLHDTRDRLGVAADVGHPRHGLQRIVARRHVDRHAILTPVPGSKRRCAISAAPMCRTALMRPPTPLVRQEQAAESRGAAAPEAAPAPSGAGSGGSGGSGGTGGDGTNP